VARTALGNFALLNFSEDDDDGDDGPKNKCRCVHRKLAALATQTDCFLLRNGSRRVGTAKSEQALQTR
jgi:hypothetical protein